MSLFSDLEIPRTRTRSRLYNEPKYTFLDTSGLGWVIRLRDFWEAWFKRYPQEHRAKLAGSFKSPNDHVHVSALTELFSFAALSQAGLDVEVQHPQGRFNLDLASASPPLFVECTVTGQSSVISSQDRMEEDIIALLDQLRIGSRFLLQVACEEHGSVAPSARKLRATVADWLTTLDPDLIQARMANGSPWPSFAWEDRGWRIRIGAIPVSAPDSDDDDDGAIGMIGVKYLQGSQSGRIRSAVDEKATKYGELDRPLLVVVNSLEHQFDEQLVDAMFGDRVWTISGKTVRETRRANGLVGTLSKPRNINLSAVLHGRFDAWSFASKTSPMTLTHHPFASMKWPTGLLPFCVERLHDASGVPTTVEPSTTVAEFFGLDPAWTAEA
jgi:hypothetical protein